MLKWVLITTAFVNDTCKWLSKIGKENCVVHVRHSVLFVMIQNSSVTYEISFVAESFLFLPHVLIER